MNLARTGTRTWIIKPLTEHIALVNSERRVAGCGEIEITRDSYTFRVHKEHFKVFFSHKMYLRPIVQ